jgi:hypothetical protein
MKKLWLKIFRSSKEAEKADLEYYSKMSPSEKWDTLQFIRETYLNFRGHKYENGKGLQRVLKITKRK